MQTLVGPTMTPHTTSAQPADDSHVQSLVGANSINSNLNGSHHLATPAVGDENVIGVEDWMSTNDVAMLKTMTVTTSAKTATRSTIKRLPIGTRVIRLVGEGAANAVFEIKVPRGSDFQGLLLRVAKVPTLGQPATYNYLFQQQFFLQAIRPVLGEYAIHQELVILHKCGIIDELNSHLQLINHERKAKFRDSFIGLTEWGLLVEDMRPGPDCRLVEFKPKWLSQSPSAPEKAIRCRQCALELRYLVTKPAGDRPLPNQKPCPLALANPDAPPDIASPYRIARKLAKESETMHDAIISIMNHPMLHELRTQQELHDPVGPLNANPSDSRFVIAMTIRDCTSFALIPKNGNLDEIPPKIRLGDLDWKDPAIKFSHWHGTEEALVNGAFYTADSIICDGETYTPPTMCLLESKGSATGEAISVDQQAAGQSGIYYHETEAQALKDRLTKK